jgi:hypothetical protein
LLYIKDVHIKGKKCKFKRLEHGSMTIWIPEDGNDAEEKDSKESKD